MSTPASATLSPNQTSILGCQISHGYSLLQDLSVDVKAFDLVTLVLVFDLLF
jgi:hypothetical protein